MTSPETNLAQLLGPVGQIGYVVNDLEAAASGWFESTGIGPWRAWPHLDVTNFQYKGTPSPVDMGIAVAFSGAVQIELIQQHNDAPSMYRDLLDTFGEGAQHVCFYPENVEAALEAAQQSGLELVQSGTLWGIDFMYLAGPGGRVIEMAQLTPEFRNARAQGIEEAAAWTGDRPVRMRLATTIRDSP